MLKKRGLSPFFYTHTEWLSCNGNYTEPLLVIGLLHKFANQNCQSIGTYKAILKISIYNISNGLSIDFTKPLKG